jgi:hypothetical protein
VRVIDKILERLDGVEDKGSFYRAFCPAHDDRNTPNLDVTEGDDGRVLLICRVGCENEDVVAALGLEMRDLFEQGNDQRKKFPSYPPKTTATVQPGELRSRKASTGRVLEGARAIRP